MRIKPVLVLIVIGTIFLSSCSRKGVNLEYTSAKGEIPVIGNLTFRFNKALVPDSLLNQWDSTDYVSFEPKIPGRFRWESADQLVFSPSMPLLPATTYKAKVKNAVLHFSKYDAITGADKISFHTPQLTLDNSQVIWIPQDDAGKKATPQVDLFFNYRVNPSDIKDKLKIEIDGKDAVYSVVTQSADNKISIRLTDFKSEDKDFDAKLTIAKGLKPEIGTDATAEPIVSNFSIPSPYSLTVQNMESEHDGVEGSVKITTSQQVVATDLKSFVKLNPVVPYTTEITDNGFIIRSDKFDVEKSYALTIAKDLRGRIGGVLKEDYDGSVAFGELESNVKFSNTKGVYLSKKGGKNIEVQITNTAKVKLVISKIYENNLLMAERYGYSPSENSEYDYASSYEDYEGESRYNYDVQLGDVIYSKEIDTRSLKKSGGGRLLNLSDYEDMLQDFKGIYHISIRSTEDYWVRDSRFISLSDLGLIVREGQDKVMVFINSIKSANAVNGVNVMLYSNNNQLIGSGSTNSDGVAEISYTKKDFSGFRPAMIIAKTADDFNYLPFNNTRVNTSRFDVGGKRTNQSGLDAFVYAERDIYRPGEKINFAVVLRDREWKSPGDIPVKMKFLMPNGKELKTFRKGLNDEGSTEANVDISNSAITGSYTLEVYTSNDVLLATKNFSVEEFVPDRIKVSAKLNKETMKAGDTARLDINATNFFGPPAANRNYEVEMQVHQKYFGPEKFEDYDFDMANQNSFSDNVTKQGKTDEQGNATESFQFKDSYLDKGLLNAKFYTTVFDETGRPVSRVTSMEIYTQNIFLGLKYDWYYYYPLNQAIKFQLAAVNKEGNAVSSKARVEVIKHEYRTSLERSGSYFRYVSSVDDKMMIETEINVSNGTVYTYVPRSPGDYEIRFYNPGSNNYIKRSFYSYGGWGWGISNSSFEVSNEGNVEISLDKKSYYAGETVEALLKSPFNGRMLVTLETDHIISYQYVDVTNRTATVKLPMSGEHVPNVYISATLIKPHEQSDIPLTVAHGYRNVKVEEKSRKIDVNITASKTVRSKTHQKVKVKAAPNSYVSLAAVDNGVLQISGFETPDPYNYFYQKKALQVSAYDLYPLLFPELRAKISSTGGDGEAEMDKRVNPMPAKRIKVVSYWSGLQKADGSGIATFEFDVPQFSGELRLMAVSFKGHDFGSGENTMTVADPIVISTALPRFLSPGDTVTVPVTMTNTTTKSASVTAAVDIDGPIKVVGGNKQSISINSKAENVALFQLVADPTIAVGKIKIAVTGLGETFRDETEISIRPPSTLQKVTGSGSVTGGSSKAISIGLSDFIPGSVNYNLVVSRSPAIELGDHLRYLVQYPYGCTEQTVSAAFPQLYYGDMADLMQLNKASKMNANTNILEAIRKIKMRQLYTGAVTLWDGGGTEDWWATIYAAHFLIEAKKAGFDYDSGLLETMLGYISNRLKNRETVNYYYNRNQNRKIAPKEVAYGLYVLALAGKTNVPSMNYYKANQSLLALDSRYLLAAAYATAGDKKSFNAMLPSAFAGEESVPQTGGSYYSDVRDEAIALNALIDADPANAQIGVMAQHVSQKLKTRYYLSTQERSFSFLALGKLARKANKSDATAEIKVNGKIIAKVDGGQWRGDKNALKGTNVEIATKGNGQLYYFWQAEGISSTGAYKEEDSYLKVRRRFYNRSGAPISGTTFRQNDLIIIGITLERSYSGSIENVVITDLLPAGFEIENPRTKEIPGMDWIKDGMTPTALDVRDDRIHFFVDANSNKQTYYYAVRAVSPGTYKMGPVSADAMYNGEYHSYNGAGIIRVTR